MLLYTGQNKDNTGEITVSVAVATGNDKTGRVLTVWVLPKAAVEAVRVWSHIRDNGSDAASCGDCKRRSLEAGGDGSCYTHAGGSQILTGGAAAHARGIMRRHPEGLPADYLAPLARVLALFRGARCDSLRLCAFGDSGMMPDPVLALLRWARESSGLHSLAYSHQWRKDPSICADHMASVDNAEELAAAQAMGVRYFRVVKDAADKVAGEIWCPAAHRKDGTKIATGEGASCARCGLCSGGLKPEAPSVVIMDHGPTQRSKRRKRHKRRQ